MNLIALADEAATTRLGTDLAQVLVARAGGVLYLRGDLGAGKTTLARGFLRAAGFGGTLRSPTYTLIEPYAREGLSVLHMDLYRLRDPSEIEQLGLVDYPPETCLWLVEWPERGAGWLPPADVTVELRYEGAGRVAELKSKPGMRIDIK